MARIDGSFLTSRQPLRVSNAVAAIVVVDRDCYLMQLRLHHSRGRIGG